MPPKTNSKAAAGRERKAQQAALKKAQEEQKKQQQEEAEWSKGAKSTAKADAAAAKADEAARKKREKQELLAAEEAELPNVKKKAPPKGKPKKKKDDLSLLQDALVKSAEKTTRKRAQAEKQKQLEHEQRLQQQAKTERNATIPMDPLLANTEQMLSVEAGTSINRQIMQDGVTSGLDAALASFSIGGGEPAQAAQVTYKEYEQRMLPIVKEDYPGLRLTQYKEKVFGMWKKSPENPANQQVPPSS